MDNPNSMAEPLTPVNNDSKRKNFCVRCKIRLAYFDMRYFSPLFIKDNESIKFRNRNTIQALNKNI